MDEQTQGALLVVDRGGLRHKSGRLVAAVITFMQVEFLIR